MSLVYKFIVSRKGILKLAYLLWAIIPSLSTEWDLRSKWNVCEIPSTRPIHNQHLSFQSFFPACVSYLVLTPVTPVTYRQTPPSSHYHLQHHGASLESPDLVGFAHSPSCPARLHLPCKQRRNDISLSPSPHPKPLDCFKP